MQEKHKKAKIITIYGSNSCLFCREAKKLARRMCNTVRFIEGLNAQEMKKVMNLNKAPTTIPQILVDGKHIGGYSDLEKKSKKIFK